MLPRPLFPQGLLHVSDIHPASGAEYIQHRKWCHDHGAVLHPTPVNLFDYARVLGDGTPEFALIVCCGLCFSTFAGGDAMHAPHRPDSDGPVSAGGVVAFANLLP